MQKKLTLLLAVITIVAADETTKKCPELTAKENFEPDKYFTGSWHVTHIMVNGTKLDAKDLCCMEFKSEKLSNDTIREILAHYYPNKQEESKFVYIENHISEASLEDKKGRYTAQYRAVDNKGKMNHKDFSPITYTIRDTDYSSYSILNMCEIWDNGNKLSIDLITSRTLNDENKGEKVKSQVNVLGLNLDQFSALKDLECIKDTNFNFTDKK